MLTTEDIKKLIEAEKEVFPTIADMDNKFKKLNRELSILLCKVKLIN